MPGKKETGAVTKGQIRGVLRQCTMLAEKLLLTGFRLNILHISRNLMNGTCQYHIFIFYKIYLIKLLL
jgi:hypothetical protein